jgi:hypothetical protein
MSHIALLGMNLVSVTNFLAAVQPALTPNRFPPARKFTVDHAGHLPIKARSSCSQGPELAGDVQPWHADVSLSAQQINSLHPKWNTIERLRLEHIICL